MSALRTVKIDQITSIAAVENALKAHKSDAALLHNTSRRRYYGGQDSDTQELLLDRSMFSGVEDVGWKVVGGKVVCVYDSDDTSRLNKYFGVQANWDQRLLQWSVAAEASQTLAANGYSTEYSVDAATQQVRVEGTCWG